MRSISVLVICISLTATLNVRAQESKPDIRELSPSQTIEREMTGAETHRYKFDLKANEFFQVRVEQKGVDVALKITDGAGKIFAVMDSPNGKVGLETLSFVADQDGGFGLEVVGPDRTAEKGSYTLWRADSHNATTADRRRAEVESSFVEGMNARNNESQTEVALAKLLSASVGWEELGENYRGAMTQIQLGNVYSRRGNDRKALEHFKRSLALAHAARDPRQEVSASNNIGAVYHTLGQVQEALAYYRKSQILLQSLGDRAGEANALNNIANAYYDMGDLQKALNFYEQALLLHRVTANRVGETITLMAIGLAFREAGDLQKALENMGLALASSRSSGDSSREFITYFFIGRLYSELNQKQRSLESYNRALAGFRVIGDKSSEAVTLGKIGDIYLDLSDAQKAIDFHNQELAMLRMIGNRAGEAASLNSLGATYETLGEKQRALSLFDQALAIYRSIGDPAGESLMLNNIGTIYNGLGETQKGLEYYRQALVFKRAIGDRRGEAAMLNNTGQVYSSLGQKTRALEYFQQALPLFRALGDKNGEATALTNAAKVYGDMGDQQKAKTFFQMALSLDTTLRNPAPISRESSGKTGPQPKTESKEVSPAFREAQKAFIIYLRQVETSRQLDSKSVEAQTLAHLMKITWALNSPAIAIAYGKQAVNAFQTLRSELGGEDPKLQKALSSSAEETYRTLADILIQEGRILEAERVLAMLKQEEIFNYLNRDASETEKLQLRSDLSEEERSALVRYNEIAGNIAALGVEFGNLQALQTKGGKLSPEQTSRYAELAIKIEDSSRVFDVFLRQMADDVAKRPNAANDLEENLALRSDLRSSGSGVVFLYTLVDQDRYRVILITPDTQVDGKSEIKLSDLDAKMVEFRAAVQDPRKDPRPLGKELYDILIKPIEKQLDGAGAKTLLWSLDGNLRLLPLAALWDGKQYFGQKYQNVTITLASRMRLGGVVAPNWRVLGLGVSERRKVKEPNGTRELTFEPLCAVGAELSSIVQNATSPGGVMPGKSLLNGAFDEAALEFQLLQRYEVVHIASHFSLNPGDSTQSFLLLGDGRLLTPDRLKHEPRLNFEGVELLTLSACNTAMTEKDKNGKEIEGFGYIAQKRGAKAILATLWSVADSSTQLLMSEFYRLRKLNPKLTKAAALQIAQQKMMDGKLRMTLPPCGHRDTGARANVLGTGPTFQTDPRRPYAHPFFWSPFVLIGNWR